MPRRSWVDALIDLIERLPGPAWSTYLAVSLILGGCSVILRWIDGSMPFPTVNPVTVAFATMSVYPLAAMHYLQGTARAALKDFRPALGDIEPRYAEFERRLTTMPFGLAIVAVVVGLVLQLIGLIGSGGGWGITDRTAVATRVITILGQQLLNVTFTAYVLRAIGQLRTIVTIHREATAIRLWDRGPHNALARFTFATAVSVSIPFVTIEIFALLLSESSVVELVLLVLVLLISSAVFIVPLRGMHRRLVAEKERQLGVSAASFELAADRLHRMLESDDLGDAGALSDSLSALVTENERLKHVSTWPWSAETLRGFVSSIAVPVLLWLVTTALDRALDLG